MLTVLEILGWVGTSLVILNYAMMSQGRWNPTAPMSLLVNGTACLLLAVNSFVHTAWPLLTVNTLLIGLSVLGLSRWLHEQKKEKEKKAEQKTPQGEVSKV